MLLGSHPHDPGDLADRLRHADVATAELVADIIDGVCRRFPSLGQRGKTHGSSIDPVRLPGPMPRWH